MSPRRARRRNRGNDTGAVPAPAGKATTDTSWRDPGHPYAVPVAGGLASPGSSRAAKGPVDSSEAVRAWSPDGPGAGRTRANVPEGVPPPAGKATTDKSWRDAVRPFAVPVAGGLTSPASSSAAKEPTTSSEAVRAWSPDGPGAGTNSVLREYASSRTDS